VPAACCKNRRWGGLQHTPPARVAPLHLLLLVGSSAPWDEGGDRTDAQDAVRAAEQACSKHAVCSAACCCTQATHKRKRPQGPTHIDHCILSMDAVCD
jgi:hypothetical protein